MTSLDAAGAQCGQQSEGGEFGVLGSAPTAYQDSTRLRAHVDHGYFGIEGYSILIIGCMSSFVGNSYSEILCEPQAQVAEELPQNLGSRYKFARIVEYRWWRAILPTK